MTVSVPKATREALTQMWTSVPPGWVVLEVRQDGCMWKNEKRRLSVITSVEGHADLPWLHVSVAHTKHIPTYEDLAYVRRHWIGELKSIMVFPKAEYHVNLHARCLHLFACLAPNGDGLPEFSAPSAIYGRVI